MNALRWILGIVILLLGGGYLFLFMISNGFRKSFGASENNPLLAILPLASVLILLAGLVWPANRTLLHLGAAAAVGLIGFCVWQIFLDYAAVLWLGILFLLLWLVFYWSAAWQGE